MRGKGNEKKQAEKNNWGGKVRNPLCCKNENKKK